MESYNTPGYEGYQSQEPQTIPDIMRRLSVLEEELHRLKQSTLPRVVDYNQWKEAMPVLKPYDPESEF